MKKRLDALNLLDADEAPDGDGWIYRDNEVDEWFRFDHDDLNALVELMNSEPEDAYGPWCRSHGERIGPDDEARQLGLVDDDGDVVRDWRQCLGIRTGTITWFKSKDGIGYLELRWEPGEKGEAEVVEFPEPITASTSPYEVVREFGLRSGISDNFLIHDGEVVYVGMPCEY